MNLNEHIKLNLPRPTVDPQTGKDLNGEEAMKKIYIGIDPGQQGACAILTYPEQGLIFDFEDISVLNHFHTIRYNEYPVLAAIEKITVNKATPSKIRGAMTKVMANMERWVGRLEALQIPFIFVTPQKWQKVVFDSMTQRDRKAMSLDLARRLYPWADLRFKKHNHRADALLIARYLQIIEKGE